MNFRFKRITEKFPEPHAGTEGPKVLHFKKHVRPYGWNNDDNCEEFDIKDIPNADVYEDLADKLASTPCKTSDHHADDQILGFVEYDGFIIKYDRKSRMLVIYRPDKSISNGIRLNTLYLATGLSKYLELKRKYYGHEIEG